MRTVICLILTCCVNAFYTEKASKVYYAAYVAREKVQFWDCTEHRGKESIPLMQTSISELELAVSAFCDSIVPEDSTDIDVQATNHFASQLSLLHESLVVRADDFQNAGLMDDVKEWLQGLDGPVNYTIAKIREALKNDSWRWGHVAFEIDRLKNEVDTASSIFDVPKITTINSKRTTTVSSIKATDQADPVYTSGGSFTTSTARESATPTKTKTAYSAIKENEIDKPIAMRNTAAKYGLAKALLLFAAEALIL